jgi:hypothetical protein
LSRRLWLLRFRTWRIRIDTPIKQGARKIIVGDWADQHCAGEQQRWAYLFSAELISKQEAEAWAEQVWPSERSEAS